MTDQVIQRNFIEKLNINIAMTKPGTWFYSKMLHHFDRAMLRMSKGRTTLTSVLTGLPMVTLTTKGAKSSQPRSVPLIGISDGEKIILIATNWGQKHYPSWYINLRACPEATITTTSETRACIAHEADKAETERYWPQAVMLYPGYERYKARIGDSRRIPIIVMEPNLPLSHR